MRRPKPLFSEGDVVSLKATALGPSYTFKIDYVDWANHSGTWRYYRNHYIKDSWEYEDDLELVRRRVTSPKE